MARPYRIVDDLYIRQGGAVAIYSTVLRDRYRYLSDDVWTLQSHMTIMNDAPVEGVDFPIRVRDEQYEGNPWLHRHWRRAWTRWLQEINDDLGVPLPVATVPPEVGLLSFDRGYDGLSPQILKAIAKKRWYRITHQPQDGMLAPTIPASEYAADSCRLLSEIQFHVLESTIDGGLTWTLWTTDEVLGYLNERISRFMLETGIIQTITTFPTEYGLAFYDLPGDLIELTRLSIVGGSKITKTTKWEMDHAVPGWQTHAVGTPERYMIWPEDSLTVRLYPAPDAVMTLRLIYSADPPTITSVCQPLPIPAVFAPYIKYGVMADMFGKQGEANDPQRAEYCEERFAEGIELAEAMLGLVAPDEQ